VKEDLWTKEPLIAHVHCEWLLCDLVPAIKCLEPLVWLCVVFVEFLCNVWTDVAKLLLDSLGSFQGLFGRDANLSLSQELLNEVGDVPASYWDVLNTAANYIALGLGSKKETVFDCLQCADTGGEGRSRAQQPQREEGM